MLHKYEWEVLEEMPPSEFIRWLALARMENRERADAQRKSQRGRNGGKIVKRK